MSSATDWEEDEEGLSEIMITSWTSGLLPDGGVGITFVAVRCAFTPPLELSVISGMYDRRRSSTSTALHLTVHIFSGAMLNRRVRDYKHTIRWFH
jgi:hypothetical protein